MQYSNECIWYPIIHRSGKIRSGGRPYFRGLGGEIEENNGGESFKREMRDSEELLSKLNPMAEEYVPSSLTNNEGYLAAGPTAVKSIDNA
ncbi:Poly(A) RNA polymerase cid13 [Trifolium repens]|nr:polyadenylate-binding protein-interacting protein [Trifolium repens]WJX61114.1 Poly(A) RNA polymerase cid13 [Trifolium repens]